MESKREYYWSREQEAKLLDLWKRGVTDLHILSHELGRKPEAVRMKLQRLGAVVVDQQRIRRTTTTVALSEELLSHEEALKLLAGTLKALRQPGQDKLELQRLRILVDALQVYDSVLDSARNDGTSSS
mgnify:CR=1 FL=1